MDNDHRFARSLFRDSNLTALRGTFNMHSECIARIILIFISYSNKCSRSH